MGGGQVYSLFPRVACYLRYAVSQDSFPVCTYWLVYWDSYDFILQILRNLYFGRGFFVMALAS